MELINAKLIEIGPDVHTRSEVIEHFAQLLQLNERISNKEKFLDDVYHRENEVSTSMGLGVAIPHTQSMYVNTPSLVFIKLNTMITWNSDANIQYIFGIAMPLKEKCDQHLKVLSKLARKLMDENFREQLSYIQSQEEGVLFLDFLNQECIA